MTSTTKAMLGGLAAGVVLAILIRKYAPANVVTFLRLA